MFLGGNVWDLGKIRFVSFREVGHLVPEWNRKSAFEFINSFVSGKELDMKI